MQPVRIRHSQVFCLLLPSRTWITLTGSRPFEAFIPHFRLCCIHCIIPLSLLNHPNSFCRGMFKLNAKFDADSFAQLSPFEWNSHTIHTHSPMSIAPTDLYSEVIIVHTCVFLSTLLGCQVMQMCANHSNYINNGWTFYGEYTHTHTHTSSWFYFSREP